MRHAGSEALDQLDALLADLRLLPGIAETARGVFYLKSKSWLHFHEDPTGLFADLRNAQGTDFDRFDVTQDSGRARLLELARARLSSGAQAPSPSRFSQT